MKGLCFEAANAATLRAERTAARLPLNSWSTSAAQHTGSGQLRKQVRRKLMASVLVTADAVCLVGWRTGVRASLLER